MTRTLRKGSIFGLVLCAGLLGLLSPSLAQAAKPADERVAVLYVAPQNRAFMPLYQVLKDQRALERVRELILPLQWPGTLTLELRGCDGEANAFYGDGLVTICYEFLDDIWRRANSGKQPRTVGRQDAVVGATLDVVLHEVGHAMFDLLKIPVLGREEDAADQVAAFTMLQLPRDIRRRLVLGAASIHASRLKVRSARDLNRPRLEIGRHVAGSSEHGTPAQRLYNLLCLAYGSDRVMFGSLLSDGFLPEGRAEICEQEYQQIAYAYRTLVAPHKDAAP